MAFARIYSRALMGVSAPLIQVEVQLSNGLPQFNLVGLPQAEVRESRERVRAALHNGGFRFPVSRITVNLAPADIPKQSSRLDLPIALGILSASGQLADRRLAEYEFVGELALTGELRPVRGALPMAVAAGEVGRTFVLPQSSAREAALARGVRVLAARHLREVCEHLSGDSPLTPQPEGLTMELGGHPDMVDVHGQQQVKRALEVAAAGGHHALLVGSPGTGKSMLASRLAGICPPLSIEQALECAALQSVSHENFDFKQWGRRPMRAPHHSATAVALVGGAWSPGEISLAHHGILHLDEMPEFPRVVLETLRQPMENHQVVISRAQRKTTYPARFQLIGTMNPCPCGYLGHPSGRCHCTPEQVERYRGRISGALLDRIDLVLEVPVLSAYELQQKKIGESSEVIRERVNRAALLQQDRQGKFNCDLTHAELERWATLDDKGQSLLLAACGRFNLSARVVHRLLRVARTLADLGGGGAVTAANLGEAMQYRGWDNH
jgi:magnesium chelatase family protein